MKLNDLLALLCIVLFISVSVWWFMFQWGMCREGGFGFWYCIQHCG